MEILKKILSFIYLRNKIMKKVGILMERLNLSDFIEKNDTIKKIISNFSKKNF